MSVLRIQKESLPTRCEICHQSDLFDPEQNACVRCDGVHVPQPRIISTPAPTPVLPVFLQAQIRLHEYHSQVETIRYRRQCLWVLGILACFYWIYGVTFLFLLAQEQIDRAELRRPHSASQTKPTAPREEKSSWGVKPDQLPSDILRDRKGTPVYLTEKQLQKLALHVPTGLQASCSGGSSTIGFIINSDGTVSTAWVEQEEREVPSCSFSDGLLMDTNHWRFKPFVFKGKAQTVCARFEFEYVFTQGWKKRLPIDPHGPSFFHPDGE
ncbi:MAG: hypothetical protein K1Y36_27815 [Blastocatellia bacterium]|nr:hypothetical protein [Blastocatellia bacterium]